MDLVQQGTQAKRTGERAHFFGQALVIAAVIVAAISVAILATSLAAGSPARSGVGSQADPLLQPAAIEFRRGEHAAGVSQHDPLLQPAAIEFRRGEHAAGAVR